MRLYSTFFQAASSIKRNKNEVVAILSINECAFFVVKSNTDSKTATLIQAHLKLELGKELLKYFNDKEHLEKHTQEAQEKRIHKLHQLMLENGVHLHFPQDRRHAEEKLILLFSEMVATFRRENPEQPIINIDIFLTHSPCSTVGKRQHSNHLELEGMILDKGCHEKLMMFFNHKKYSVTYPALFKHHPKIQVHYFYKFDETPDNTFICQVDHRVKKELVAMNVLRLNG